MKESAQMSLARLQHSSNITKAVGSILEWAILLRDGLQDPAVSLPIQNILWFCENAP